jgi:hypothetical protein
MSRLDNDLCNLIFGSLAGLYVVGRICPYRRAWIDWMILWIYDDTLRYSLRYLYTTPYRTLTRQ